MIGAMSNRSRESAGRPLPAPADLPIPLGAIRWLAGSLLVLGAAARIAPFFDHAGRLLRQFPTEDGYLMLTIARNMALGHGMSIAEGTIASNGVQPLATLLWAACFALVGGDRTSGIALVLALEVTIAVGAAWLLFRLGRRVLGELAGAREIAGLAVGVWWAAPLVVGHSMNGLESGLYAAAAVGAVWSVLWAAEGDSLRRWLGAGLALGLAFLARNDAVFLCLAAGGVHLLGLLPSPSGSWGRRTVELGVAALGSVLVASPWLLFNLLRFGHPVPVSGRAESLNTTFGSSLDEVPAALAEHILLLLPIPATLEPHPAVLVGGTLLALVWAATWGIALGRDRHRRGVALLIGIYALALCTFYGMFFRAPYFMSRYLFPLSPFYAIGWAVALVYVWRGLRERLHRPVVDAVLVVPILVLAAALNLRLYLLGDEHPHFQVVRWVEENVPPAAWVGAIQSGTLGFFHDRTINLDGKVNPQALEARRRDEIPRYVVESEIEYLADWMGILHWLRYPEIEANFSVVVADPQANLGVLQRNPLSAASRGDDPRETRP